MIDLCKRDIALLSSLMDGPRPLSELKDHEVDVYFLRKLTLVHLKNGRIQLSHNGRHWFNKHHGRQKQHQSTQDMLRRAEVQGAARDASNGVPLVQGPHRPDTGPVAS